MSTDAVGTMPILSSQALDEARALGIEEASIPQMLRRSTPFSHPKGNRRFEDLMFMVEGDVVQSIAIIDQDPVQERYLNRTSRRLHKGKKEGIQDGKPFIDLTE
jgi:hypothetical protein